MSHENFPNGEESAFTPQDLATSFAAIEVEVMDLEPKVRELNRQLVAFLGRCPGSESGNWAYLARNDDGGFCVAFETLSMDKVLHLVSHIERALDILEEEGGAIIPGHTHATDLAPSIIGEAAHLMFIPTTHVRVVRPS